MLRNPTPEEIASGPRRRCSECGYFPLGPLSKFSPEDINSSATVDSYVPSSGVSLLFPLFSLFAIVVSWFGKVALDETKTRNARAKVIRAHQEVLPRSPNSLICPRCYDVLEVM
jgi:hypothetical protein